MGTRVFLAAALMLLTTFAFAEHAISLDSNPGPASQNAAPAERASAPSEVAAAAAPAAASVKVAFPSELDIYVAEAATREVCDTVDFGGGDVRTACTTEPLPVRARNPDLRGICITRYGNRTCY